MKKEVRRQKTEGRRGRNIMIAILMMVSMLWPSMVPEVSGQIILQEEEFDVNWRNGENGDNIPMLPWLGLTTDQYAPLDGGLLLLGCLGGTYLLGKRKNKSSITGLKNKK